LLHIRATNVIADVDDPTKYTGNFDIHEFKSVGIEKRDELIKDITYKNIKLKKEIKLLKGKIKMLDEISNNQKDFFLKK